MITFMENIMKLYGKTCKTWINTEIVEGIAHCHRPSKLFSS